MNTCGEGLAHRAPLPEKLAELTHAFSELLEYHRRSLQSSDESGRKELAAYTRLAGEYRQAASVLQTLAGGMSGYRDLPMAPHDIAVLSSRENHDLFARVVQCERELRDLLDGFIASDEKILAMMG